MDRTETANHEFAVTINYLLELANRSYELFKSSDIDVKRKIINLVFSNLTLDEKKLEFSMRKPFDKLLNVPSNKEWRGG